MVAQREVGSSRAGLDVPIPRRQSPGRSLKGVHAETGTKPELRWRDTPFAAAREPD